MEIVFETNYDQKAYVAMTKVLRKTVRRKKSVTSRAIGGVLVGVVVLLNTAMAVMLGGIARMSVPSLLIWNVVVIVFVVTVLFDDQITAYLGRKRALPGTSRATTVFSEDSYTTTVEVGRTEWSYDKIQVIAETPNYFVFALGMNHAQVYDKRTISGGTVEEFRKFLEKKTGKQVTVIR